MTLHVCLATPLLIATAFAYARPQSPADWQEFASADLDATHSAILAAHPGVIDKENPTFNQWVESGYRQARKLLPQVIDYETMLSVERFYTTGFRDGHLGYSDNIRDHKDPVSLDGWRVSLREGKYIVDLLAEDWPLRLPLLDSDWLGCDNKTPNEIIEDDVAPFTNRQTGDDQDNWRAQSVWIRHLPDRALKTCRFRNVDGEVVQLPVAYRALQSSDYFALLDRAGSLHQTDCRRHNSATRLGDVLWIRAGNFSLRNDCGDVQELTGLLKQLQDERGFSTIVFDVRGNAGGDSSIGDRIFDAATGGLDVNLQHKERLVPTYAQWRVSDVLVNTAQQTAEAKTKLYGADSDQSTVARSFYESAKHAKEMGELWLNQAAGYRLTAADIAALHGHLKKFQGKLAIVTDSGCVSACLDFVDDVKQMPHSIQLGETTGSDTVYIDTGNVMMPSGNHIVLPLKVWRNRLRANNQAWAPDRALEIDMRDDQAVQSATLTAIQGLHARATK